MSWTAPVFQCDFPHFSLTCLSILSTSVTFFFFYVTKAHCPSQHCPHIMVKANQSLQDWWKSGAALGWWTEVSALQPSQEQWSLFRVQLGFCSSTTTDGASAFPAHFHSLSLSPSAWAVVCVCLSLYPQLTLGDVGLLCGWKHVICT